MTAPFLTRHHVVPDGVSVVQPNDTTVLSLLRIPKILDSTLGVALICRTVRAGSPVTRKVSAEFALAPPIMSATQTIVLLIPSPHAEL
jgi:hypothetical protein